MKEQAPGNSGFQKRINQISEELEILFGDSSAEGKVNL
jgi:hypothetical protein